MSNRNLLKLFKYSAKEFARNPVLALPTLIILVLMTLFSYLSASIVSSLSTNLANIVWIAFFSIFSLAFMSVFFSGLISMAEAASGRKPVIKSFFSGAKLWHKNFVIMILIIAVYNLIQFIAQLIAMGIGRLLSLSLGAATLIFFLFYFMGLVFILIFLTFASFVLITKKFSIAGSIKHSIDITKKNYAETIALLLIFFVINYLIGSIAGSFLSDIINSALVVPYIAIILTRFVSLNN